MSERIEYSFPYRLDPAHHDLERFRLEQSQVLHLITDNGEPLALTVERLIVDIQPNDLGTESEVGQVAETTGGKFLLCVDDRWHERLYIELHDSQESLVASLWDWEPLGPFTAADAFLLLYHMGVIELKPAIRAVAGSW